MILLCDRVRLVIYMELKKRKKEGGTSEIDYGDSVMNANTIVTV